MNKRIVIAIATLIIYTAVFWGGLYIYYTQEDNALLKRQTDAFQSSVEKVTSEPGISYLADFSMLDMKYVRSEYEKNGRGQKYYQPTIFYESDDFISLPEEIKIEFFREVGYYYDKYDGKLFGEDSNEAGHGALHILSGGHEYALHENYYGSYLLFEDGKTIHGISSAIGDISYQYGHDYAQFTLIFLGGFVIIAGVFAYMIEKRATAEKAQREKNAFHDAVNNHTWEFPVRDFHDKCKESGITDTNTEFSRKKVENIAKSILVEAGVPEEAQSWYLQRAVKYYNDESNRIVNEAAAEENQWKTTLHTATLSEWSQGELSQAEKVRNAYGIEKRKIMLLHSLESARSKLASSKASEIRPVLKKEKDWAVHGGIADGIAGPAAGIVTAAKVMQENERIRAQNAQMMKVALMANETNYATQARCRREIKEYEEELRVLPEKVVLDTVTSAQLLSAFDISVKDVGRNSERDTSCMTVRLSVRQVRSLKLDIPDDVKIVLDGTVFAWVYTDRKQSNLSIPGGMAMGEIIVPLGMYGIPYNNTLASGETGTDYTIRGLCNRFYGDINTKYVCRLETNHNLWLMER